MAYLSVKYGYSLETNRIKRLLSYLIYLFPTERAEIDFSVLHLSNKERGKLLDIGCGSGAFISKMAKSRLGMRMASTLMLKQLKSVYKNWG